MNPTVFVLLQIVVFLQEVFVVVHQGAFALQTSFVLLLWSKSHTPTHTKNNHPKIPQLNIRMNFRRK
jgi:hypothetical protein